MSMLVGRYEKFHVFAMSCWNGIPNSCIDLIKIWHFMRKYGSLKPQMVTINLLVAMYAKQHLSVIGMTMFREFIVSFLVERFVTL